MANIDRLISRVSRAIGQRIRNVREAQGLSQQAVADALTAKGHKFSRLMVTNTEAASRPITVEDLAALAVVLNVPVTYFFGTPEGKEVAALDSELMLLQSHDLFLEELQGKISEERSELAKWTQEAQARRAAMGA